MGKKPSKELTDHDKMVSAIFHRLPVDLDYRWLDDLKNMDLLSGGYIVVGNKAITKCSFVALRSIIYQNGPDCIVFDLDGLEQLVL